MKMARSRYSLDTSGTTTKATASSRAMAMRSWRMGRIWLSAA
jgi:hypothetical protein